MLKTRTEPNEDPKRPADNIAGCAADRAAGCVAASLGEQPPAAIPQHGEFAMHFTSSPRGARLARRIAVRRLGEWGYPPTSDTSETVALLVAEFTANAVRHGGVPGHDFHLRLAYETRTHTIRIEVTDACPTRPPADLSIPSPDGESGRGLLLVHLLATRWGSTPHRPAGKTVWADVAVPALSPLP